MRDKRSVPGAVFLIRQPPTFDRARQQPPRPCSTALLAPVAADAADRCPACVTNLAAVKTRHADPSLLARDTVTAAFRDDHPSGARTDPSRFRAARFPPNACRPSDHRAPTRRPPPRPLATLNFPGDRAIATTRAKWLTSPVLSVHLTDHTAPGFASLDKATGTEGA